MRVNLFGLGLLTCAIALPHAVSADDSASILAHHRAYVGWQADDNSVGSLKLTYVIERRATPAPSASGAPAVEASLVPVSGAPNVTEFRRGLLYRQIVRTGRGLTRENGFNGRQFWRSDESGNAVELHEKSLARAFTQNVIDSEGAALAPSTVHGTAQVGSNTADIVRISPADGVPADLYVDRATGAYLRIVIDPDDPLDVDSIDVRSYREFAPGKRIVADSGGTTRGSLLRLVSAELNPQLDPASLRPPTPATSWTFGSTDAYPITIVSLGEGGGRAVHVRASINGHEGTFLLDSGASGILVYTPFADTIGLEELGTSAYTGVNGGTVGAKLARVKDLALGRNVLHDVIVNVSTHPLRGIDGILGYPLLARAIVDVDLGANTMTILDPTKFDVAVGNGAFAFPVDLTTRQPRVAMAFAKNVFAHPVFDTGDSFNVLLAEDLLSTGKVTGVEDTIVRQRTGGTRPGTVGRPSTEVNFYLNGVDGRGVTKTTCIRTNMSVGPYRYEAARTCFAPGTVFGHDGGLIGFDFLRHFNWTFDYPEAKVVLTPNNL